jgi:hypothetical protein
MTEKELRHMTTMVGAAIDKLLGPKEAAVYITRSIDNDREYIVVHDNNKRAWIVSVEPMRLP